MTDVPEMARCLKIHFIGTGRSPTDEQGFNVLPVARRIGVHDNVTEHPARMGYLDVLVHLKHATGAVIVGSTEPHYTPSKVFQAVQARRPVLAFLHEASTAVRVLHDSGAGQTVTLTEERLPSPAEVASALNRFFLAPYNADQINWAAFRAFSARESARVLADAMDEAIAWFAMRGPDGSAA
jgi:hypothetical protein